MALRPHHLVVIAVAPIELGTIGLATYRYLGHQRPEARSIPERQVFDRTALYAEHSDAGFTAGECCLGQDFTDRAEDAQCAAIAAWS